MEPTRYAAIESIHKDLKLREWPTNMAVNIALVDKSAGANLPILYILKRDLWDAELAKSRQNLDTQVGKNPLLVLGPILSINRHDKCIYLMDNTLVSYNHLIAFSAPKTRPIGTNNEENISVNAMQALIDALRCQPIRPIQVRESQNRNLKKGVSAPTKAIETALLQQLRALAFRKQTDSVWSRVDHWLCEVQT